MRYQLHVPMAAEGIAAAKRREATGTMLPGKKVALADTRRPSGGAFSSAPAPCCVPFDRLRNHLLPAERTASESDEISLQEK
ncbi:hypothetical protein [Nonomuraea basaltis]|uniref:hypothetical protein n=1 Tax=Nonomuraea basaltis TaxID=2495887 RepID=UPI00148663C0|nr:hypothetical protein [Nonomuraea basaltis]